MTNLEWIRTLSEEEFADWLYDEWLHHLQYRWSSSRGGLIIWLKDRKYEPTISKMEQVEDEPKTQMKPQNSNLTFEKADEPQTDNLFTDKDGDVWEWRGDAWYCISGDKPQTEQVGVPFGEMGEATFKSHCLNCQRDTADIKCLDCDGNKYFLPYGSKTDCAWK